MARKLRINYQDGEQCVMLAGIDSFDVTLYGVTTIAQNEFAKGAGFVKTGRDIWKKKYRTEDELIEILKAIAPAEDVYFDEEWITEEIPAAKVGSLDPANPNYIIVKE